MIKFLIDNGGEVNMGDYRDSPLSIAAEKGGIENVRVLVENGADINSENENGDVPVVIASMMKQYDVVKFLVENGAEADLKVRSIALGAIACKCK